MHWSTEWTILKALHRRPRRSLVTLSMLLLAIVVVVVFVVRPLADVADGVAGRGAKRGAHTEPDRASGESTRSADDDGPTRRAAGSAGRSSGDGTTGPSDAAA